MRRYRAKRDLWAVVLLSVACAAAFGAAVVAVASPMHAAVKLALGVVTTFGGAFLLLLLVRTHYDLGQGRLRVQHGLLRWTIPVKEIRSVAPMRGLASSAALSRERLKVAYGHGYAAIEISPRDARAFVSDLRAMAPGIKVDGV